MWYRELNPVESQREQKIFLSYKTSSRVLGPTQLPIQGVWGNFFPSGKATEAWSNYSPPSTAMIYDQWSYSTSPIRLHGEDRAKFSHLLCFKGLNSQLPQDKKKHSTGIALCSVKQLLHIVRLEIISPIKTNVKVWHVWGSKQGSSKKYALSFVRDIWNRNPYDNEFTHEYHPL